MKIKSAKATGRLRTPPYPTGKSSQSPILAKGTAGQTVARTELAACVTE